MTVETPFRDFLAFWERAADRPRAEQAALWEQLYAEPNRAVLDLYDRWFAEMGSLDAALDRYGSVAGALEGRFAALELERAATEIGALFDVDGGHRIVALVGLFTATAWMDDEPPLAEPTVFFALEAGDPSAWNHVAALHELAHLAHVKTRSGAWPDGVPAITLAMEAIAITATRDLAPEAPVGQHFTVDDHPAWERACRAALPGAARELLACLGTESDDARRRFFWPDWGREERDVPERFGYFAAGEVGEALAGRHGLAAVVRWSSERAAAECRAALEALA